MSVNKLIPSNFPGILQASGYASSGIVTLNVPAGNYVIWSVPRVIGTYPTDNWKTQAIGTTYAAFNTSGSGGGVFVLPVDESALVLATGGNNTTQYTWPNNFVNSFVWDGTNLQAASTDAGYTGLIMVTTNGGTWTTKQTGASVRVSSTDSGVKAFVYNANVTNKYIYCAATNSTTTAVYTSTDSITWTARTLPVASAAGGPGNVLINSAATNKFTLNNGNTSNMIIYSTDAVTWTQATVSTGTTAVIGASATNGTASTNQIYVYGINNTTNNIVTSTDAVTWTSRSTGQAAILQNLEWFNNYYIATYVSTTTYHYSTNGVTWTSGTLPQTTGGSAASAGPFSLLLDNKMYYATGTVLLVTTNGTTWTVEPPVGNAIYYFRYPSSGLLASYTGGAVRMRQPMYYAMYRIAQ